MTKTTTYDTDGTIDFYVLSEYDENGNEMKETFYGTDDRTIRFYYVYEYDTNGYMTKWTTYHADSTIEYVSEY